MRLGYVCVHGRKRSASRVVMQKPNGKEPLGWRRHTWEYTIYECHINRGKSFTDLIWLSTDIRGRIS
jgi:hypothetical protein